MCSHRWFLVLTLSLASGSAAQAQDAGQAGITVGYPAAIGVIWHLGESFALRPDFSFLAGTNPSISVFTTTAAVSAIVYMSKPDTVRAYLSPRIGYQRDSSRPTDPSSPDSPATGTYIVGGSAGVEVLVQKRIAIFGETGAAYSRSSTTFGDTTSTLQTFGTRAGVGMIFYF
jgi:hypothetical protein